MDLVWTPSSYDATYTPPNQRAYRLFACGYHDGRWSWEVQVPRGSGGPGWEKTYHGVADDEEKAKAAASEALRAHLAAPVQTTTRDPGEFWTDSGGEA